jgi:hypothetical protein
VHDKSNALKMSFPDGRTDRPIRSRSASRLTLDGPVTDVARDVLPGVCVDIALRLRP